MTKSPSIIINKLVLVGQNKNYIVPFSEGLNIIYGDSDTGKSSILNLIDYCLGGSKVYLYDEIEANGKYCLLEVRLNNKTYTIKRDIFKPLDYIEVFQSDIDGIHKVFSQEYGPNFSKEGPAGYFSDFLMNSLNIPIVKVKQAPTKVQSDMIRLSFRDIFKFCYIDQDDVGSKDFLDAKNPPVFTKNKTTFKFLQNLLDTQITEIQSEISQKTKKQNELKVNFKVISEFLRDTKIDSDEKLYSSLQDLQGEISYLDAELTRLDKSMLADTSQVTHLRTLIGSIEVELNKITQTKSKKVYELTQNVRLKKDYENDITKLKISLDALEKVPNSSLEEIECPLCKGKTSIETFKESFDIHDKDTLEHEIKSLRNRCKDLQSMIDEDRNDLALIEVNEQNFRKELEKAKQMLDIETKDIVSPFLSQRDVLLSQKATVIEKEKQTEYLYKIRKQLNEILNDSELLGQQIKDLQEKLETLMQSAPSLERVLDKLSTHLKEFLEFIPIRKPYGISISDKTFLPIVRNREYQGLTSGGLRTIVSIGYLVSLFKHGITNSTNLPSFLMIDTVGKYLGKTKQKYLGTTDAKADQHEGIDDPSKYINIFKYFLNDHANQIDNSCQIILVDNDIPHEVESLLQPYVSKRFSVERKPGFEIGFINDII